MAKYYGASAEYNKPTGVGGNKRLIKMLLLGVGAIILISIAFIIVNGLTSGSRNDLMRFIARQSSLQTFINKNQELIKDEDLSKINSDANVLILSDATTLKGNLSSAYGIDKIPEDMAKSEADTTSETKLTEATQLGRFNQTYVQILDDKLAAALQLAQKVEVNSRGELKANVQQSIANLKNIQEQLSELNL